MAPPLSPAVPPGGEQAWDELSPDRRTCVRWALSTGRMSHEIVTPALYDAATDAPILLLDDGYDGRIRWSGDGRFTLSLRHYWRDGSADVEIDRKAGTFRIVEDGGAAEPLAHLRRRVEARFRATGLLAGALPATRRPRKAALLLLAIAAAAALYWLLAPHPAHAKAAGNPAARIGLLLSAASDHDGCDEQDLDGKGDDAGRRGFHDTHFKPLIVGTSSLPSARYRRRRR